MHFTYHNNNDNDNCFEIVFKTYVTQTCGHVTNSCHLDTTRHHPAAAVASTVVAEMGTADSTGRTIVGRNQVGCRLPTVEHYKPQLYAQTLYDICPIDMTAYTPSALSHHDVSPYDPSYHISPA
ncbi:hypothetical protein Tco_1522884 [Tanacetum coccineum]